MEAFLTNLSSDSDSKSTINFDRKRLPKSDVRFYRHLSSDISESEEECRPVKLRLPLQASDFPLDLSEESEEENEEPPTNCSSSVIDSSPTCEPIEKTSALPSDSSEGEKLTTEVFLPAIPTVDASKSSCCLEKEEGECSDSDSSESKPQHTRPICRFYQQGRCRYGDRCYNWHPERPSGRQEHHRYSSKRRRERSRSPARSYDRRRDYFSPPRSRDRSAYKKRREPSGFRYRNEHLRYRSRRESSRSHDRRRDYSSPPRYHDRSAYQKKREPSGSRYSNEHLRYRNKRKRSRSPARSYDRRRDYSSPPRSRDGCAYKKRREN